jgi:hypothetical protein
MNPFQNKPALSGNLAGEMEFFGRHTCVLAELSWAHTGFCFEETAEMTFVPKMQLPGDLFDTLLSYGQ